MLKFRTMCADADAQREALEASHDGNERLFKLRNDPRVTRVGAVLRRYSVDELPQLVRDEIARSYPDYTAPPPGDDQRPNATTWTVFKDRIDRDRKAGGGAPRP